MRFVSRSRPHHHHHHHICIPDDEMKPTTTTTTTTGIHSAHPSKQQHHHHHHHRPTSVITAIMKNYIVASLFISLQFMSVRGHAQSGWNPSPSTDPQPRLVIKPEGVSRSEPANSGFVLTCSGSSEAGLDTRLYTDLKWYNPDGYEIPESASLADELSVLKMRDNLMLSFSNPKTSDSGVYTCKGTFQKTDLLEVSTDLMFYQDVTWQECPKIQSVILGKPNENIRCSASASPSPTLTWYKDGQELDESRTLVENNGIRILDEVNDRDGGTYLVRAQVTQTGRLHDRRISVEVQIPPQITRTEVVSDVIEGQQAELRCESTGKPQPQFTWLDAEKRNLSSLGGYVVDQNRGTLLIERPSRRDNGDFTCIAENGAGRHERTVPVRVTIRAIINSFENTTGEEGHTATLECRGYGDPLPDIHIRRDGDENHLVPGLGRVEILDDFDHLKNEWIYRVTISNLHKSDDGLYYCMAKNLAGSVDRVGHLQVRFRPNLDRTPSTNVKAWNGKNVNITCIADAIPNATIEWYHHGRPINQYDTRSYRIFEDQLGVSRIHVDTNSIGLAESLGTFMCVAINPLGRAELPIELTEAHIPGAPVRVNIQEFKPTAVYVSCEKPAYDGGLPLKNYWIEADLLGSDRFNEYYRTTPNPYYLDRPKQLKKTYPAVDFASTFRFDNLKPNMRYDIRCAVENDVGISPWSNRQEFVTPKETAPDPPSFITHETSIIQYGDTLNQIQSPTSTDYRVTWTKPEDNGYPIEYYELVYYQVEPKGFTTDDFRRVGASIQKTIKVVEGDDATNLFYIIYDLRPGSQYQIEISAHNRIGDSDRTKFILLTPGEPSYGSIGIEPIPVGANIGMVIGSIIVALIVLLIIMDAIFYVRYRVGALYFLRTHVCGPSEEEQEIKGKGELEETQHMNGNGTSNGHHTHSIETDNLNASSPHPVPKDSAV